MVKNHKRRKRRPQNSQNNVPESSVATKPAPAPLRIPVEDPEDDVDDYDGDYDDGGLYEDELIDTPEGKTPEASSNGVEGVDFVKATPIQEMAGKLFQERQARLNVMQKNANLENEISILRKEVADTRIQRLKDEAAVMKNQDAQMFADVGLSEGDQLKPTEDGFIIIPKK